MKDKLKYVKLSEVIVGERFREDMGDLEELMESISDKGVLQPITISANMELLAGGRRFAACQKLELKEIPALVRVIDSEIDAREIELIENIHRKDFTWKERAQLTSKIHHLYMEKDPNWSMRKTAQLIDKSPMDVSRAEKLTQAINIIPDIGECKTADDASKLIKRVEERAIIEELAKRQQAELKKVAHASDPKAAALLRASQDYQIIDVFEGLKKLKTNGKFSLIECDPPYGIEFNENADRYAKGSKTNDLISNFIDISTKEYVPFLERLIPELYRVAAKDSHLVFWFNMMWYNDILRVMKEAGWKVDVTPAIWLKTNRSENGSKKVLGRGYEPFLIARKGDPIILTSHSNVFWWPHDEQSYHPTQKPVKLLEDLINTFCHSGDHILSPFAGSGVCIRAAYLRGCFCSGFDSNTLYKDPFLLAVEKDCEEMLKREQKAQQREELPL